MTTAAARLLADSGWQDGMTKIAGRSRDATFFDRRKEFAAASRPRFLLPNGSLSR